MIMFFFFTNVKMLQEKKKCIHTYMPILSSVPVHYLEGTQNALSSYESWNGAKKRDRFLVSKKELGF